MELNCSYQIAEFLQVNSELGQWMHGHKHAEYYLLAVLESKRNHKEMFNKQK